MTTLQPKDALTGLSDRNALIEALRDCIGRCSTGLSCGVAALCIDMDRFKLVNGALGHAAGDELLCLIADRLQTAVQAAHESVAGASVIVARPGSDEFAVLVANLQDTAGVGRFADHLLAILAAPYHLQGRIIHSTASIGIALCAGRDDKALDILQRAELAMCEAKQSGRARAVLFHSRLQDRVVRSLELEGGLRSALLDDSLSVVYQPIVDLQDGVMKSVEALVRWTHPTLGPISPAEFVPIAEESGLVVQMGSFVLRKACEQFREWQRLDPARAPETVSVNLSRTELALGHSYIDRLRETLDAVNIDPDCVQLEVTEREVARDPALSVALTRALRDSGVRLAMDDFGTGASSLACLRHMPFDTVKIDQAFLASLESERDVLMVLHATVALIENLGMCSVAEGVEKASQLAVLQSVRCRRGQGYLFGKPLSGDMLLAVDCLAFRREPNGERGV